MSSRIPEHSLEHPALFYGARANYPRMRGFVAAIQKHGLPVRLVNTGQHWDRGLVGEGFGEGINEVNLDTRTSDIDTICKSAKDFLGRAACDGVFVYGDTASAMGPALAAKELGLPLVHLEGGFRTYDATGRRTHTALAEEAIRNEIDQISDLIVPLLPSAARALYEDRAAGLIAGEITDPVGHSLADAIISDVDFHNVSAPKSVGLLTIHRRANLEDGRQSGLAQIIEQVDRLQDINWLFPVHPTTRRLMESASIKLPANVNAVDPLDHAAMIKTLSRTGIVVSDSAGLQVEAGLMGRRLVIPRGETEYPDLLSDTVVLCQPFDVEDAVKSVQAAGLPSGERFAEMYADFGGGNASRNIFRLIAKLVRQDIVFSDDTVPKIK